MYTPPPDFVPLRTADGSFTLHSEQLTQQYHSIHGAVQESMHVFIKSGIEATGKEHLDILEVGLGTGLNMLLTWIRCIEGKNTVRYTALEPFPVGKEVLRSLAHCNDLAWPGLSEPFLERMAGTAGEWFPEEGGFLFRSRQMPVQEFREMKAYDLVFFDAFSPRVQPEMWTLEVFQGLYDTLRPGGMLVTYCAKGVVRRTMQEAGFAVERLKGPPNKAHMLRAIKEV